MDDSNLRTFNINNRFIGTPGSTLRSRIDSIVGIGALTSGWAIFADVQSRLNTLFTDGTGYLVFPPTGNVNMALDYLVWLLIVNFMAIDSSSCHLFLYLIFKNHQFIQSTGSQRWYQDRCSKNKTTCS